MIFLWEHHAAGKGASHDGKSKIHQAKKVVHKPLRPKLNA
jgi:hypothetical protein